MSVVKRITETESKQIYNLFINDGLSPIQIGERLHRDPSTIRRVLRKLGIQYNNINYISYEELDAIIADYKSGLTPKELGNKYNRSDGYLINLLKKKGIYKDVNNHISKTEWDKIAILYAKGLNDDILKMYPSLPVTSLYSKMSEMNIRSGLRNHWSENDKNIVKDFYLNKGTDYIYELINHRHTKDSIESLALKEFGYYKGYYWTEEEDALFKESYPSLPINDVLKLFPNRTLEALRNRAKVLGISSFYVLDTYWSNEENQFLIDNWKRMSDVQLSKHIGRNPMSIKDRRNLLGLYRINKRFLGYETLKRLLRARTWNWKQNSMKECNYRCVLTGDKEFHIHHLYGFSDIFNIFVDIKNLTEAKITSYSFEELEDICNEFIHFHDTYPLGVCVREDLHVLFHSMYGKHNNTPEQWNEFVDLYISNKL